MLLASELLSTQLSTFSFSFFGIEEPVEWIQNLYEYVGRNIEKKDVM